MQKDEIERRQRIDEAWDAYEGRFPDSLKWDKKKSEPNFNAAVSKCKAIVDISNAWLFGKDIAFNVEEDAPESAQKALDEFWAANNKDAILLDIGKTGKISGHVFVKVIPNGRIHKGKPYPRLVVLDTGAITVTSEPGDVKSLCELNINWTQSDGKGHTSLWREHWERVDPMPALGESRIVGGPEQWEMVIQTRTAALDGRGLPVDDTEQWVNVSEPVPWDGDRRPIFDCQNASDPRDFWGRPDITQDIIAANRALNLVRSCEGKTVYHYGYPREVGYGFDAKNITFTPGGAVVLPNEKARYELLPANDDLQAARAHAQDLEGDIDEMSGVPGVALGRARELKGGDIPAATMRLELQPLEAKTYAGQSLYGVLLEDISSYALELMGEGVDWQVDTQWPADLIPKDDLVQAQALTLDVAQGVSKSSYQMARGYDPDYEAALKADEVEDAQENVAAMQMAMGGAPVDPNADPNAPNTQEPANMPPNALGANSDGAMMKMGNAPSKPATGRASQRGNARPARKRAS